MLTENKKWVITNTASGDMRRLQTPKRRECERCGRREIWESGGWRVEEVAGVEQTGSTFCIHEWDITGDFSPVERE